MPGLRKYDEEAIVSVLFHQLKEPFFDKLRT
jgi:hypothetical protein